MFGGDVEGYADGGLVVVGCAGGGDGECAGACCGGEEECGEECEEGGGFLECGAVGVGV